MPRKWVPEELKKKPCTVALPKRIVDHLATVNKSEVLTQICNEQMDRILGGDVDKAIEYRKSLINHEVATTFKENEGLINEILSQTKRLDMMMDSIRNVKKEFDIIKREFRVLEKGADKIVSDLRVSKREAKKKINETVRETVEKLEREFEYD